ncbi:Sfi1 spindle body protein-domain-containing protein [Triangularia verruculosa]|uniref:Sfi1 spindle body protein-domain-containing protein n=1 Tax=Triangularia verruculosa TaxID=2587418 RepID=A0AAN6XS80_9PEZI|nr:Sfi1 spindle body protein-domain-containing protein [Triangularia verruculosa]
MPPHSSLPLRDGRAGPPLPSSSNTFVNSSQLHEPYSDEDIELIHEIVALGESIFPTLPERDKLPTEALFRAAEEILPSHGYDPDDPPSHISRLIFKIGGQRSGETLSDKFRTVLEGMGIKLEFVPSSPPARPESLRSFPLTEEETTVEFELGTTPRRQQLPPQRPRRHSSISRRSDRTVVSDEGTYELPVRARSRPRSHSVSFLDEAARHQSDDESTRPFSRLGRDGRAIHADPQPVLKTKTKESLKNRTPAKREAAGDREALRRITNWRRENEQAGNGELEDAPENAVEDWRPKQAGPHIPAHFRAHVPIKEAVNHPRGFGSTQPHATTAGNGINRGRTASPSTIADTEPVYDSPRSDNIINGVRRVSDSTAPTQDDDRPRQQESSALSHGDRSAVDIQALEAKLAQLKMAEDEKLLKDAISSWKYYFRIAKDTNCELLAIAEDVDDRDIKNEVLEVWKEEYWALLEEQANIQAFVEHREYTERMERRAKRVYEIYTVRNTLAYWHDFSLDERDRTAVARRHLVRKKAFEAWRQQLIEDETKVTNFILMHALQKWGQSTLHSEVRHRVAIKMDQQALSKECLDVMQETQKMRVADTLWSTRITKISLRTWFDRANVAMDQHELAIDVDERLVLDEATGIWHEETLYLQDTATEAIVETLRQECRGTLSYWQEQARLNKLLRWYQDADEEDTRYHVLDTWYSALQAAIQDAEDADSVLLRDPLTYWDNAAKLKMFTERDDSFTKFDVLAHWANEERLAFYRRYTTELTMRGTLSALQAAGARARNERAIELRKARDMDKYYVWGDVLDEWLMALDVGVAWRHRRNADVVNIFRTCRPIVDGWLDYHWAILERDRRAGRQADVMARRFRAIGTLDKWPVIAEQKRRERLMSSLRQFRRDYKVKLANSCLDWWFHSAGDHVDTGRYAHDTNIHYESEDINGQLNHWVEVARMAGDMHDVAVDAELEVYCNHWIEELHEAQANAEYAINYDEDKTLGQCWQAWEFVSLQQTSRNQMALTVQDRNDKRWCSQILDDWQQQANPEMTQLDPRASIMSRRSTRARAYGSGDDTLGPAGFTVSQLATFNSSTLPDRTRPSRPAYPETPRVPTVSQLGRNPPPSARFSTRSRNLGPMLEFDETSFLPDAEINDPGFMSTPTRRTSTLRPLGYRPTTTPSAILPSPLERGLRSEYGANGSLGTTPGIRSRLGQPPFRGSTLRTRVEFADISEASAEDQ